MAQPTPSLFGVDPALIEQALLEQQQNQALAQSKMTPLQLPNYFSSLAGQQLGQVIKEAGGALAGEDLRDPRLIKAEKIKGVMAKIKEQRADITDPIGYYTMMAKEFENAGLTEEALGIIEKARSMGLAQEKDIATIEKLRAEALAKTREKESGLRVLQRERAELASAGKIDLANEVDTQIRKLNSGEYKVVEEGVPGNTSVKRKVLVDGQTGERIKEFTPYDVRTASISVSPQLKTFNTETDLRAAFLKETKMLDETLAKIDRSNALGAAAIKNPAASKGFQNSLADLMSPEGQRAVSEIAAWSNTGDLPQRINQTISTFLSGTTIPSRVKDVVEVLKELKQAEAAMRNAVADQYNERAAELGISSKFITGGAGSIRAAGVPAATPSGRVRKEKMTMPDGSVIDVEIED